MIGRIKELKQSDIKVNVIFGTFLKDVINNDVQALDYLEKVSYIFNNLIEKAGSSKTE